jgi:four helix bundle protein
MSNYDLEDRTIKFFKNIIILCKKISINMINKNLIDQLLRSATSIGANYREANECDTKKDFKNKIRISKKEARETIYWLELLIDANVNLKDELLPLLDESKH